MVAPVNDFDKRLQAESPRTLAPRSGVILSSTVNTITVNGQGTPSVSVITLVATLLGVAGTVAFTTSPSVPLSVDTTGLIATLKYSDMGTSNVTVTATMTTSAGLTYSDSRTIQQISIGSLGYQGALDATRNNTAQGTLANRPTGSNGDLYFATDNLTLYQKTNGNWVAAGNNYTNTNQLTDGANLGQTALWPSVTGNNRPADNATVGAPSGTTVGGTEAGLVASRALNGDSAYNAVNNGTTGLNARMSLYAANLLSGGGGFIVGSLTVDNNGNRTGGSGLAFNQKGFAAYNPGGYATTTLDAASGAMALRAITVYSDVDGSVVLSSGKPLTTQVSGNPNLVARLSSWVGYKTGNPQAYINYDTSVKFDNGNLTASQNGEYGVLPAIGNSGLLAIIAGDPLPIATGMWYTVSFWAWNQGSTNGSFASDVYYYDGNNNNTVDTDGIGIGLATGQIKFFSFTEKMPSNPTQKAYLRLFSGDQNNQFLFWNVKVELGRYVTPWNDSIITPFNASTFIQAAAIQSAMVADLRTVNYAEDAGGNPTSGAKIASTGTAIKVASNSLQIGTQIFSDYFFRILQAIDGSIAAGRVIWRGNNDITTRGGAPNIACLSIAPTASQVSNSNFQQVYYGFTLTPSSYTAYTDNLDAMAQINVQFFTSSGSSSFFTQLFMACPSRTYDGAQGAVSGSLAHAWRFAGAGATPGVSSQYESNGVFTGYLRVRIGNSYGWSATQDFAPGQSVGTALQTTTISGSTGSSGGGSGGSPGGGGGACPAPWVKIQLVNGEEREAGQLYNGARLAAVNDNTLEPVKLGGVVRDIATIFAQRYRVKLTNGEVSEWSENHRFYLVQRGWVEVQRLLPGDHILGQNECIVESILAVGRGPVVSFRVEGAGTYFGSGMLSHNLKVSSY